MCDLSWEGMEAALKKTNRRYYPDGDGWLVLINLPYGPTIPCRLVPTEDGNCEAKIVLYNDIKPISKKDAKVAMKFSTYFDTIKAFPFITLQVEASSVIAKSSFKASDIVNYLVYLEEYLGEPHLYFSLQRRINKLLPCDEARKQRIRRACETTNPFFYEEDDEREFNPSDYLFYDFDESDLDEDHWCEVEDDDDGIASAEEEAIRQIAQGGEPLNAQRKAVRDDEVLMKALHVQDAISELLAAINL